MRLGKFEINTINRLTNKHFGDGVQVFLFGSRTDDHKKDGDIDLFIKSNEAAMTLGAKTEFLVDLKQVIGDQKIDVVFDNAATRRKTAFYSSIARQMKQLR